MDGDKALPASIDCNQSALVISERPVTLPRDSILQTRRSRNCQRATTGWVKSENPVAFAADRAECTGVPSEANFQPTRRMRPSSQRRDLAVWNNGPLMPGEGPPSTELKDSSISGSRKSSATFTSFHRLFLAGFCIFASGVPTFLSTTMAAKPR